jgi:hypothetical protein
MTLTAAPVPAYYKNWLVLANFDDAFPALARERHIDLSGIQRLDAYAAVGIACALMKVAAGAEITLTLPDSDGALAFLQDLSFPTFAETLGTLIANNREVPGFNRPRVELQHFTDNSQGEALANLLFNRLDGFVSPQTLIALHEATAELSANAIEHSESPQAPVMAAYTNHVDGEREYLVLAVGDLGIGVERSLGRKHTPDSEEHALRLAFEELVSGTGERGRGRGLYEVERTVRELGGFTVLRSGSVRRQEGPQYGRSYSAFTLPGTIVGVWVPRFGEDRLE